MKHTQRLCIAAVFMASACVGADTLRPLDDSELSAITGQDSVQLTLRLRNNIDEANNPVSCSGQLNPCRMGIEFASNAGVWLMLKDYYGAMEFNDMRIESASLGNTNTAYFDPERFLAVDGLDTNNNADCLLEDCNPAGLAALKFSYPLNKEIDTYNDFNIFMNVGRVAIEFDEGSTPGYMRDVATGSVLGYRFSDSTGLNSPGKMRFDGEAYVFGF